MTEGYTSHAPIRRLFCFFLNVVSDNCQVHDWTEIYSDTFFFSSNYPFTSHIRHNSSQRTNKQIHIHILAQGIANINKKKHDYKIPPPAPLQRFCSVSLSDKRLTFSHALYTQTGHFNGRNPLHYFMRGIPDKQGNASLFMPWCRMVETVFVGVGLSFVLVRLYWL